MRILKENFESALWLALMELEAINNGRSAFAAGLREVLKASEAGERVTVEEK